MAQLHLNQCHVSLNNFFLKKKYLYSLTKNDVWQKQTSWYPNHHTFYCCVKLNTVKYRAWHFEKCIMKQMYRVSQKNFAPFVWLLCRTCSFISVSFYMVEASDFNKCYLWSTSLCHKSASTYHINSNKVSDSELKLDTYKCIKTKII